MQGQSTTIVTAIKAAEIGIDYDRKNGAFCPLCQERIKVTDTKPWVGNSRIRYHKCSNERCLLHQLERSIKSIETF